MPLALGVLLAVALALAQILWLPTPLRAQPQPAATAALQGGSGSSQAVGSVDVAPVRILGVPALSVAAPVLARGEVGPDALQRARVIEGNLALLYEPHALCTAGEGIAESLLEGLVLHGPPAQRLCSGDPWALLGRPGDRRVVVSTDPQGDVRLQAMLKGRPAPLPLLSVTEVDARLHGLPPRQLAERWQVLLQRRLRDAVAGLVALFDDHYAVGDVIEVDGVMGEVVDVGLLMTELRSSDQRVVLFANGSIRQLLNHTKIRSGIELLIPLAEQPAQLERALAVVAAECEAFAADPHWGAQLLAPPVLRGVKRVAPGLIELSVLLTTCTGRQWEAQRVLLQRLVLALQQAEVQLACSAAR